MDSESSAHSRSDVRLGIKSDIFPPKATGGVLLATLARSNFSGLNLSISYLLSFHLQLESDVKNVQKSLDRLSCTHQHIHLHPKWSIRMMDV